ncbi:glutaredoxin-like protein [Hirsutella rhossiliensis]|uniref:Glutaredoxin-like protein n=1 Tax=Hirsutella rhossiliensis TaxID=111463 RepID=A0A9P8MLF6_9HYPO|nr:glutaredoxin-like protein [Hirsutella rhossiliensis]KAH0957398.1 glutaredoxin-like protein [Hirsutella rhossiliensis]
MFASGRLLQACRITLFTRDNCSLCTTAKDVLSQVGNKRPFVFQKVDLALPESRPWRELYDFDIPVIHISKAAAKEEDVGMAGKAVKLMHRFTPEQVEAKMDKVQSS